MRFSKSDIPRSIASQLHKFPLVDPIKLPSMRDGINSNSRGLSTELSDKPILLDTGGKTGKTTLLLITAGLIAHLRSESTAVISSFDNDASEAQQAYVIFDLRFCDVSYRFDPRSTFDAYVTTREAKKYQGSGKDRDLSCTAYINLHLCKIYTITTQKNSYQSHHPVPHPPHPEITVQDHKAPKTRKGDTVPAIQKGPLCTFEYCICR